MSEISLLCPIAPAGLCLYEACPYWEEDQGGCTACFQEAPAPGPLPADAASPCVIPWQEESD
ncbi:MAG: hypothetical protein K6T55_04080 [Syntrophobacterales bacterium]|nr:hypothetical protein [Syntrophobacterales bacterium]